MKNWDTKDAIGTNNSFLLLLYFEHTFLSSGIYHEFTYGP